MSVATFLVLKCRVVVHAALSLDQPCWHSSLPVFTERAACLPRQASVLIEGHGDTVTAPQLIRMDTVDLEGVCGAAVAP